MTRCRSSKSLAVTTDICFPHFEFFAMLAQPLANVLGYKAGLWNSKKTETTETSDQILKANMADIKARRIAGGP